MKTQTKLRLAALLVALPFISSAQTWNTAGNSLSGTEKLGSTNAANLSIVTNNTTRMTVASGGAVGIGTTSPNSSSLLDITSTTKGVLLSRMTKTQRDAIGSPVAGLLIYQTTNTPGFYYFDGTVWTAVSSKGANKSLSNLTSPTAVNQSLIPGTNNTLDLGSSSLTWRNGYFSGNVGIGSTAPHAPLQFPNNLANRKIVLFEDGNDDNQFFGFGISANLLRYQTSSTFNDHVFYAATSSTTSNELMRIKGTGLVGIGTSSPAYQLTLGGTSSVFGVENTAIFTAKNSGGTYESYLFPRWSDDIMYLNYGANGFNIRNNSSVTTMFMTNSGNVGIGGTLNPAYRLDVTNNTVQGATAIVRNLSNAPLDDGLYVQAGNTFGINSSKIVGFFDPNMTALGAIVQNAGGVSYTTSSDRRLKTNIRDTKFGLSDVRKIEVRDYNYIGSDKEQTGFIAQQLNEVFPNAVVVGTDDVKEHPWMVDYGRITPLLVKAIQDLDAINTEKQAQIDNQQKEIDELKSQMSQLLASSTNDGAAKISIGTDNGSPVLGQNIPNPFDNSTVIPFRIPKGCSSASIVVTESATGKIITAIPVSCNETHAVIEAGSLAPGTYQYTLYIDGKPFDTKQMILTR